MNNKKSRIKNFLERNRQSNNYLLKKRAFSAGYKFIRAIMLFGLCFLILQPLVNKLAVSFMEEQDLYDSTIVTIARHFTLENYKLAAQLMNYWQAMWSTAGLALVVSILQIVSCTLVGYGFARYRFPLKNMWFAFVILIIVVPAYTIQAPLILNFSSFDILGIFTLINGKPLQLLYTPVPYVLMCLGCMGLKSGLYIYLIRQYFRGIPKELEEAAYVDGCGKLKTFLRIMVPDSKPIVTSCFLFAYVWQWTDSLYVNMFLSQDFALLPTALTGLSGKLDSYLKALAIADQATAGHKQMMIGTGILMVIAPLVVIYLVAQKGFVESLSQTGIKM